MINRHVTRIFPLLLVSLLVGCSDPAPLHIGFIGGITGRVADLGAAGRDGALLAVEHYSADRDDNQPTIQLLIEDDKQDSTVLKQAMLRLLDKNVKGIVGPMTSSMAIVATPIANLNEIVLISPTTSTNELNGRDDYFFRVYPPSREMAYALAIHAYDNRQFRQIAVLMDEGNYAHTASWFQHFQEKFESLGGEIVAREGFISKVERSFHTQASRISESEADAVMILANALDTAMFSQQLRKMGSDMDLLASEWSATTDVLAHGGSAVEGMEFFNTYDASHQGERYKKFVNDFEQRFGYKPGFASIHAYDATNLLINGVIESKSKRSSVKTALDRGTSYQILQGTLRFDKYGDPQRDYYLMSVGDNGFERIVEQEL